MSLVAFLELVEFLEHRDRNRDVVLFEVLDAVGVVQDDVGVQHKQFLHRFRFRNERRVQAISQPSRYDSLSTASTSGALAAFMLGASQ